MTSKEGAAVIEAILFTMGDSVEINALAKAMEVGVREVKDHIDYLKAKYENEMTVSMKSRWWRRMVRKRNVGMA